MKRIAVLFMLTGFLLFVISAIAVPQEKTGMMPKADTTAKAAHKYVGVTKCKMCHSSVASGNQFKIWTDSKHSKAIDVLATAKADSVGKTLGVDKPQENSKCLGCHETVYGAPASAKATGFNPNEGVGCEACHGPGSDYMAMSVMKDKPKAMAAGLKIPDEKTCVGCHNEKSPTYKTFVYANFFKQIAHPIPPAKKVTPSGTESK
jgi:hypothetical protein